ncbi:MAG: hypothetical protein LAO24_19245 [Acidobacteriia bacterium]|nr:hypothetical protein [Terriglobia bacterium]
MNSQQDEVLSRLTKLERENKCLRVGGLVLLLFVIGLFMGAARTGRRILTADEFVLQDDQGHTRAQLTVDSKRVSLLFFDEAGRNQMSLAALDDNLGHGHASLSLGEGAVTRLVLAGTGKDEWMTLSDGGLFLAGKDAARVVLSASGPDSPSIEVADPLGYAAEIGVTGLVSPTTGKTQKSSAASLVLLGKGQSVLWSAP